MGGVAHMCPILHLASVNPHSQCATHIPQVSTMEEALKLGADGVAVVAIVYRAFQVQAEQDGVFASSGTYNMKWMSSLIQQAVNNVPAYSMCTPHS